MEIYASGASSALVNACGELLAGGYEVESRRGPTFELTGVHLTLTNPLDMLCGDIGKDDFRPALAAAEALHLISGEPYGPAIRSITADLDSRRWSPTVPHYGLRLADQLPALVWKLAHEPDTRQAVAPIWHSRDLLNSTAEWLCATQVQLLLRNYQVGLIVTMRSCDVWHGLPYNIFQFAALQATVALSLNVGVGRLTFQFGSLHLYQRHEEAAARLHYRSGPSPYSLGGLGRPLMHWTDAVARARTILAGELPDDPTSTERWYHDALFASEPACLR